MTAAHREKTDLLLQPPLAQIDMLNWKGFDRAIAAGYEYAVRRLEKLPVDSPLRQGVQRGLVVALDIPVTQRFNSDNPAVLKAHSPHKLMRPQGYAASVSPPLDQPITGHDRSTMDPHRRLNHDRAVIHIVGSAFRSSACRLRVERVFPQRSASACAGPAVAARSNSKSARFMDGRQCGER